MKFNIGDKIKERSVFTSEDVVTFAKLSGDNNPIHISIDKNTNSFFGKPIVHGFLCASAISKLIATKLPGPGSIYLHQELNFVAPLFHNEELYTEIEITNIKSDKNIFYLNTRVIKIDGTKIIDGRAVVKLIEI